MKKALSLILALVLCLSLCACGGNQSSDPNPSAETQPSKEDILKEASDMNLVAAGKAFEENKVNAQDTYYNKYYTIVGTVRQIESDEVIINPINAVSGSAFSSASQCHVKLPVDEIKMLSTFDVIKVCGKLTDFKKGYDNYTLTLDEAFYVDNTIVITAEISDVNNYMGGKKSIVLRESAGNGSVFYEIVVAKSDAENSEEAEFMGTTYQIGDKVTFTGVLRNNPNMGSNYYDVVTVNTISKN